MQGKQRMKTVKKTQSKKTMQIKQILQRRLRIQKGEIKKNAKMQSLFRKPR